MEHAQHSFIPLLIVVGIAFAVPIVLSRLRGIFIPIIIGEILAGIIVGKSGLDLVQKNVVLEILSTLGFIYLMFLSGLEINFSNLLKPGPGGAKSRWRHFVSSYMFLASAAYMLAVFLSVLVSFLLVRFGLVKNPWMMALILSTTSLGVVIPVLKQEGFTGEPFGQLIIACSLVADFASIFLISVYVLVHNQGLSAEILLILILLAVFTIAYRTASLFHKHPLAGRFFDELSSATSQIKLRGSLALALFFIVLARTVGSENILGAFLAGVIVSMLARDQGSALREKLDAIGYGFFIPIFFVMVGVGFDLPALLDSGPALLLVPLLTATAYMVKILPALLFRVAYSWRHSLAAGALLSARLSLIIAASAIGLKLGVITDAVNSAIILTALATCILSPLFFKALAPEPRSPKDRILLVGCRHMTKLLAERLLQHGLDTSAVCSSDEVRRSKIDTGVPSLLLRDRIKEELKQAGIEDARVVVVLEERDEDSLLICRMAHQLFGVRDIIACVQDPQNKERFRRLGVRMVTPALSTSLLIESMIMNPAASELTGDIDGVEIRQIKLKSNRLVGFRIDDLLLPDGVSVMSIQRSGNTLMPDNHTLLRENDTLNLVGSSQALKKSMRIFQSARSR